MTAPDGGHPNDPEGRFTEPGRHVDDQGVIRYAWPPEGRFADLWARVAAITTTEERETLMSLISTEMNDKAVPVAYMDTEDGVWHDVEPDWTNPPRWMDGLG